MKTERRRKHSRSLERGGTARHVRSHKEALGSVRRQKGAEKCKARNLYWGCPGKQWGRQDRYIE